MFLNETKWGPTATITLERDDWCMMDFRSCSVLFFVFYLLLACANNVSDLDLTLFFYFVDNQILFQVKEW